MPNYTYTNLKDQIVDPVIHPNVGSQVTISNVIDRAVRMVFLDCDFRSSQRRSTITPNIFDDVYDYTAPSDLKDLAVIDIIPQVNRKLSSRMNLVTPEFFDRKKLYYDNLVTVTDDDFVRQLRLSIDADDTKAKIAGFDSTTSDGSNWALFGDATNVVSDTDNYVDGGGSVKFDLVGSGTTAGLQNAGITSFDITDYLNNGVALVWIYVNSTTNLTNFIIRLGSDPSNYYSITATVASDGNAFRAGWNLIRWNFSSKSTTGTPTDTAIDFCAIYMTKTSGKDDDGYRLDDLQLHIGEIFDVLYYTKYPWQTSSGVYTENSAGSTTMLINADTDEFDLMVMKGKVETFRELRDYEQMNAAEAEYQKMKKRYEYSHKSRRLKFYDSYAS